MTALRNVSVRFRFYLVIGLVSVALTGVGLSGLLGTRSSGETINTLFEQAHDATTAVGSLREALSNLRRNEAAMVAVSVSNPTGVEDYHRQWKAELANLEKGGQHLVAVSAGNAEIARLVQAQNTDGGFGSTPGQDETHGEVA